MICDMLYMIECVVKVLVQQAVSYASFVSLSLSRSLFDPF